MSFLRRKRRLLERLGVRKRTLRGGHDPREMAARSVEARRRKREQQQQALNIQAGLEVDASMGLSMDASMGLGGGAGQRFAREPPSQDPLSHITSQDDSPRGDPGPEQVFSAGGSPLAQTSWLISEAEDYAWRNRPEAHFAPLPYLSSEGDELPWG